MSHARIALRFEGTKVLIVGEVIDNAGLDKLGPGGFQIGDRWRIHTGAGPPTTVVVEKLVLLLHGNGNQLVGAIGRIANLDTANRIAGLCATAYLAIPAAAVPGVSEIPIMPLDQPDQEVTKILFNRGRELVHDGNWMVDTRSDPDEAKRIRDMNHAFLVRREFQTSEIRTWRWIPRDGKSFLLVEAIWIDDYAKHPLFAVDAIILEGPKPKILSFSYKKAEWMRASEFQDFDWRLSANYPAFLNAWKIGANYFFLTYLSGYEGYSVDLEKMDFAKGLIPVLSFGN